MPTDCYACEHSGVDAPFRERFVRRAGWRVAHDFNSSLAGWVIMAPIRHVHSLTELTPEEATSLGALLREASIALERVTGCSKTYVMLFAEAEGFEHLHVHVVPRMPDQPQTGVVLMCSATSKTDIPSLPSGGTRSPRRCSPLGLRPGSTDEVSS